MASPSAPPALRVASAPVDAERRSAPRSGLLVAVVAATAFVATYLVFVGTATGRRVDDAAAQLIADAIPRAWAAQVVAPISVLSALTAAVAVALITLAARQPWRALVGGAAAALIVMSAEVLKLALVRPDGSGFGANSFPSGHTAVVAALGVQLWLGLSGQVGRWLVLLAAAPVVLTVGVATVVLDWHRPSDVIGSVLIALVVAGCAVRTASSHDRVRG